MAAAEIAYVKQLWRSRANQVAVPATVRFFALILAPRIAYIQDPDGIFFCLYDHPEEPWEGPIPDHY